MKKLLWAIILGIFIIGIMGVFAEENVTCSSNTDCGQLSTTISCKNSTHLCTITITPTCANSGTNESSCDNVTIEDCQKCNYTCGNDSCIEVAQTCDSGHLNLCLNEIICEAAGGEWENSVCSAEDEEENETEEKPACSDITKAKQCIARKDCRYIVAEQKCEDNPNYNGTRIGKIHKLKETLQAYLNSSECPEACTCAGSTIKCETESGRVMIVVAGRSGNIIIQTKNINASTTVVLIKNATGVFGNFSRGMKKIKFMPDEIREKVLNKLKMRNCSECNMSLGEDGSYEMNVERQYRIIGIFPRKIVEVTKIDSETGNIIVIKRPWWRFLAFKSKD